MKLLIDECVDERLRLLFPGYDCQTARFAKFAGLKNGQLLDAAETAGFDVLITVDQNIPDHRLLATDAGAKSGQGCIHAQRSSEARRHVLPS